MKKLLIIMALIAAGLGSPAFGQDRSGQNPAGTVLTLHTTPCVDPLTVPQIKPVHLHEFKASTTTLAQGEVVPGCWTRIDDEVWVVDAAGDVYGWPLTAFGISSF